VIEWSVWNLQTRSDTRTIKCHKRWVWNEYLYLANSSPFRLEPLTWIIRSPTWSLPSLAIVLLGSMLWITSPVFLELHQLKQLVKKCKCSLVISDSIAITLTQCQPLHQHLIECLHLKTLMRGSNTVLHLDLVSTDIWPRLSGGECVGHRPCHAMMKCAIEKLFNQSDTRWRHIDLQRFRVIVSWIS
jgi:hypothetical protein